MTTEVCGGEVGLGFVLGWLSGIAFGLYLGTIMKWRKRKKEQTNKIIKSQKEQADKIIKIIRRE